MLDLACRQCGGDLGDYPPCGCVARGEVDNVDNVDAVDTHRAIHRLHLLFRDDASEHMMPKKKNPLFSFVFQTVRTNEGVGFLGAASNSKILLVRNDARSL